MSNYAHVENGSIQKLYDVIPTAWRNVSGLDKLSDEDLVSLGWYKIVKNRPGYDSVTHRVEYSYRYDATTNTVIETSTVVDVVPPSIEEARPAFLRFLREIRNQKLAETDFTQLADVVARNTSETNQAWSDYRQELRDLPLRYSTEDVINIERVEWPSKPE